MKPTGYIYQNTKREQVDRHGPPCRYEIVRITRTDDPNCPEFVIMEHHGDGHATWICGADTAHEAKVIWNRCFEL